MPANDQAGTDETVRPVASVTPYRADLRVLSKPLTTHLLGWLREP